MSSDKPDLLSLDGFITTDEDIRVLRASVPLTPDWVDRMTELSEAFRHAFPEAYAARQRRTFEGFEPFEL
jgi:hypothetical protein